MSCHSSNLLYIYLTTAASPLSRVQANLTCEAVLPDEYGKMELREKRLFMEIVREYDFNTFTHGEVGMKIANMVVSLKAKKADLDIWVITESAAITYVKSVYGWELTEVGSRCIARLMRTIRMVEAKDAVADYHYAEFEAICDAATTAKEAAEEEDKKEVAADEAGGKVWTEHVDDDGNTYFCSWNKDEFEDRTNPLEGIPVCWSIDGADFSVDVKDQTDDCPDGEDGLWEMIEKEDRANRLKGEQLRWSIEDERSGVYDRGEGAQVYFLYDDIEEVD